MSTNMHGELHREILAFALLCDLLCSEKCILKRFKNLTISLEINLLYILMCKPKKPEIQVELDQIIDIIWVVVVLSKQ